MSVVYGKITEIGAGKLGIGSLASYLEVDWIEIK